MSVETTSWPNAQECGPHGGHRLATACAKRAALQMPRELYSFRASQVAGRPGLAGFGARGFYDQMASFDKRCFS